MRNVSRENKNPPPKLSPYKPRFSERVKRPVADRAADLLAIALRLGGASAYRGIVNALWDRQPVFSNCDIKLVFPEQVSPDPAERPVVERIFAAYKKAKLDQSKRDPIFLPRGGWKNVLDSAYSHLVHGFENDDIEPFHYFLSNFGAWDAPTGIEETWALRRLATSHRKRTYFEQHVMRQRIRWWETFEAHGRGLSALVMPRFGNQSGALVNGHLILPNAIFSDFYGRLLAGLVADNRPVISELGGGFGRLCYFLSCNLPDFVYLAFDLPECLCCASYYLMRAFPHKRFLLYGEGDLSAESLSAESFAQYDFILRPSYEIAGLADESVDLFVNENSLGMMTPALCKLFVQHICRTSRAFWHRNHEVRRNRFADGTTSLVNQEYPICRDRFWQVIRHCDIARVVGDEKPTSRKDMFWYYYRRKDLPG